MAVGQMVNDLTDCPVFVFRIELSVGQTRNGRAELGRRLLDLGDPFSAAGVVRILDWLIRSDGVLRWCHVVVLFLLFLIKLRLDREHCVAVGGLCDARRHSARYVATVKKWIQEL